MPVLPSPPPQHLPSPPGGPPPWSPGAAMETVWHPVTYALWEASAPYCVPSLPSALLSLSAGPHELMTLLLAIGTLSSASRHLILSVPDVGTMSPSWEVVKWVLRSCSRGDPGVP